jgi:hypothetical protein
MAQLFLPFVLFHSPNPKAVIARVESGQYGDHPPKFPPISAGEHLRLRTEASRRQAS